MVVLRFSVAGSECVLSCVLFPLLVALHCNARKPAHQAAEQSPGVLESHCPQLQHTTSVMWQQCQPSSMLILSPANHASHLLFKARSDQSTHDRRCT